MKNTKGRVRSGLIMICGIILAAVAAYSTAATLKEFTFDEPDALVKWSRMVLNGDVDYKLLKAGDNGFVSALSDKTCSAIYYRLAFKLKDYPYLSWKWRVTKFPDKTGAMTDKEKDDYAARVYVVFPFLSFSSSKFIEYVWDKDIPEGTVVDSPEGDNIKIVVARSGECDRDEWKFERRNVYDDYVKAFGAKPSLGVGAVAIMCDADSTKSLAESKFDEITISSRI